MASHSKKTSSTSNRGFASMDAEKQRAIASKGGQSVPNEKRSFSQNRELAAQAGRKGGQNVSDENRSFSRNRDLAAQAGRKGGQASHGGKSREHRV
jgi:general stress protein YciG